jgi:hypothetical protein
MRDKIMTSVSSGHLLEALRYEVFRALRLPPQNWKRPVMNILLHFAYLRMIRMAAIFNRETENHGFAEASRIVLPWFTNQVEIKKEEELPDHGPLIVACNHPGSFDALVIAAHLKRTDLKLIARDMPLLQYLPGVNACMIYSTRDMTHRATVLRQALRHLESGGALLLFAGGNLEPDPAYLPQAVQALNSWTSSLSLFLKRIAEARISFGIASRMIDRRWVKHPLVSFRQSEWDRQFMAEFLQTITQVLFPGKYPISPMVTFSRAYTLGEITQEQTIEGIRQAAIAVARKQMALHLP